MSKLSVERKTVKDLLCDKKADFLIPDYQRPYAWEETECQTLWDDIVGFAFPDSDYSRFNAESDEYFLGPIVTFMNQSAKQEVIDGQQRLTTLLLLLRGFYSKFKNMQDEQSKKTRELIGQCLWKTDEFGEPDKNRLKLNSEVASDDDKNELLAILREGVVSDTMHSRYARTYRFFSSKIAEFINDYPAFFQYLPVRLLNNCILLPIEADTQDTALRIFSTLNDRGKPLSDADIFKAQFYKFYSSRGLKNEFVSRWKNLEETTDKIFHPIAGTPMDELFTRYMYFLRAKQHNAKTTTEALRKFYEKDGYKILRTESALQDMETLAQFWKDVDDQSVERFSSEVLRRFLILGYSPNGMWTYFVSVYFMAQRERTGDIALPNDEFVRFLDLTIAFTWAYAIERPGVNSLRAPMYAEMINIVEARPVTFDAYRFSESTLRAKIAAFAFLNGRPITKSMLALWAFMRPNQDVVPNETVFEIEHIFAKKRQEIERGLSNPAVIESLGNKSLLEKKINIRAADYRFADKARYYNGFTNDRGQTKPGTTIQELKVLAAKPDFTEGDIIARESLIIDSFVDYLRTNGLLNG